ncbi:protein kinase domain-containing protein [Geodermatophilus sp. SYSU D00684]
MTTVEQGSRTLGDRYELQGLIATGGMGQVWRGRDHLLARPVAVKVLRSEYADDPTFLARFRNEARHAAALTHPNIATVLDYGEGTDDATGEHLAYLVMELVEGAPLSTLIQTEGPLDADAALSVLRQAAAGLAEAHRHGVVHRDVKPSNILVRPDGRVKLTDFGIAWSAECVPLTQTGQVIGTAQYMSPEQAAGERVSPASDVYALGLVGYESLTGHAAFTGTNPVTVALKQVREQPEPLPEDLPPDVRELIGAALTKDPGARLPDGAAFLSAVEETLDHQATPVPPTRPVAAPAPAPEAAPAPAPEAAPAAGPVSRPEPHRRRRALVLLPLLLVLLVAGGVLFAVTRPGDAPVADAAETQQAGIVLRAADYVGRPVAEVADDLTALGLTVGQRSEQTADAAPGTVVRLDPVDVELAAGDRVQVFVAVAPATAVPEPGTPAAGAGPGSPGGAAPESPAATPEAPAADGDTPGATTPEATTPEATTPEAGTPGAPAPEATTPESTTPESTTPEAGTAEGTGAAGATPEGTPESTGTQPSGGTPPEPTAPATGTPGDTALPATEEPPAPDAGTTSTGEAPATSPAPDAGTAPTGPAEPARDGSPAGASG